MYKKKKQRERKHHDSVLVARRRDRQEVLSPSEETFHSSSSNSNNNVMLGGTCTGKRSEVEPITFGEIREEDGLKDAVIRVAAGTRPLEDVTRLALVIDSSKTCVEGLWTEVPRLHTLVLDGSRLLSFRDLGVGLRYLNTLSLEYSGVEDLDGIGALCRLRKLRLAHNRVSDVTPLACHRNLQALSLKQNRISEVKVLDILSTLPMLYSLDLRRNPIMESLSNLPGGNGRGVVHKLIPQIRILEGVHLTNESDKIDVETLDEAVGLIYQGASRARAAWAEEDATTEMAAATAAGSRQGRRKDGRLTDRMDLRRRRSRAGVVGPGGGAVSHTTAADHGIVDWDSDLTQGGGQAFSGKPSLAIRRHKLARYIERRCTRQSPIRVLETLDLAKMMESGLKRRQAHSFDKVSEWRMETPSDSLSHKDLAMLHEWSASPGLSTSSRVKTICDRSVSSTQHHRLWTSVVDFECAKRAGKEGANTDARGGKTEEFYSAHATENAEKKSLKSGKGMSGRPWTTGQFGKVKRAEINGQSCPSVLGESDSLFQVRGPEMPREVADLRLRKRRPQTATFPARPGDDEEESPKAFSWQSVWHSLQTSRIFSERSVDELVQDAYPRQSGRTGPADRLRRVDFRQQRRARNASTRLARTGGISTGGGGGSVARERNSASEDYADSSDGSTGTADRDEIKRRATDLTSSAADLGVTIRNPSGSISTPRPPTMRMRNGERRRGVSHRQQARAGVNSKKERRTTSTSGASYLSFVMMDETTANRSNGTSSSGSNGTGSEDERSFLRVEGGRRARSSRNCSGGRDVNNRGEDCEGSPTASEASSLRASRKLGFDLRKSLAAIDEWTEQITTTRDGYGAPRQTATEGGQSIIFFVQGARGAAASSCLQDRSSGGQDGKVIRQGHRANPSSWRAGDHPIRNLAAISGRSKVAAVDTERVDSEDNGSEDESVLSVAAARLALGISKTTATAGTINESGVAWMPRVVTTMSSSPCTKNRPHRPPSAEIDALTAGPGCGKREASDNTSRDHTRTSNQTENTSLCTTASGLAVGMSDEALQGMLRRHPRTVPELRTKQSFRRFFQGMAEKRMSRLLRGAYEGTLPADELNRKVKKRLRLVGDMLAW